jgi:hypothetical protein
MSLTHRFVFAEGVTVEFDGLEVKVPESASVVKLLQCALLQGLQVQRCRYHTADRARDTAHRAHNAESTQPSPHPTAQGETAHRIWYHD